MGRAGFVGGVCVVEFRSIMNEWLVGWLVIDLSIDWSG